jgi:periplasmic divalent cation tolerance protein
MIFMYVTLNTAEEARTIGRTLLERGLANCVNVFPITCIYRWEGEITEEPETVLIVKTREDAYDEVAGVIKAAISYTNCVAQLPVTRNTPEFLAWLDRETARPS